MTKLHFGGRTGTRVAGSKREVINGVVDIEPMLSDDSPLVSYGYCAVRQAAGREFFDRSCAGGTTEEVLRRVGEARDISPDFDTRHPLVRVARVTIQEG